MAVKLPREVFEDGIKWIVSPSKVILDSLSMWPEQPHFATKTLSMASFLSALLVLLGQLFFVTDKKVDMASLAYGLSLIVASVEILVRRALCFLYRTRMAKVLHEFYYNFWPLNGTGQKTREALKKNSWFLIACCSTYTFFAFLRAAEGIILSYLNKDLPLCSKYPFDWDQSPYYEMLFVWQSCMIVEMAFNIGGFDLFFLSLLFNCGAQFALLKASILKEYTTKPELDLKTVQRIVARHNQLIEVCKEVNEIFRVFILVQYLANIGAVCLSSFMAVTVPEELSSSLPFALGHTIQIFLYCRLGEYLTNESSELSTIIYKCNWHLWNDKEDLKKYLILIMARSQKPVRISVGGFGYLSISSFMKLIQFSFSVFTFLNKLIEKQNL